MPGERVPVLTDEHRDGRVWVDGEGDLWMTGPYPEGWVCIRRVPFAILTSTGRPEVKFGPYTAVLDAE